ncbi:DUF4437 domain-containing protein [Roseibium sp. SCP14]|uniref:DUF4437 domain-containing protein n=1 Tax=Roseibium sp. SCP14 TaxID=3141375 RepID=UPI0033377035
MKMQMMFLLASIGTSSVIPAFAMEPEVMKLKSLEDLDWETTPEGVGFAALQGNRFEESYMAMVRLPAGLSSPLHIKSAAMFGVVLSGEIVHLPGDNNDRSGKVLKSGAFYEIPAGMPHISKCVSAMSCITFLFQDGPFDFLPVKEGGR